MKVRDVIKALADHGPDEEVLVVRAKDPYDITHPATWCHAPRAKLLGLVAVSGSRPAVLLVGDK